MTIFCGPKIHGISASQSSFNTIIETYDNDIKNMMVTQKTLLMGKQKTVMYRGKNEA